MSISVEQIKKYAEIKGLRVEESHPQSFMRLSGDVFNHGHANDALSETDHSYWIGIEYKKGVFYWWESWVNERCLIEYTRFDHRYSQITGAKQKGMKGFKAEIAITEFLSNQ